MRMMRSKENIINYVECLEHYEEFMIKSSTDTIESYDLKNNYFCMVSDVDAVG